MLLDESWYISTALFILLHHLKPCIYLCVSLITIHWPLSLLTWMSCSPWCGSTHCRVQRISFAKQVVADYPEVLVLLRGRHCLACLVLPLIHLTGLQRRSLLSLLLLSWTSVELVLVNEGWSSWAALCAYDAFQIGPMCCSSSSQNHSLVDSDSFSCSIDLNTRLN